jgi:SAM-dependent methyltransferase
MDQTTAKKLCAINTRFYQANATSFSQTRNAPWSGWRRCMEACGIVSESGAQEGEGCRRVDALAGANQECKAANPASCASVSRSISRAFSLLDIACGNLRFEAFLECEYPAIDWRICALDNCETLVDSSEMAIAKKVSFICEDILVNMLDGLPIATRANIPAIEYSPTNIPLLESVSAPKNVAERGNAPMIAQSPAFDFVVSFGFIHHIPGFDLRVRFLKEALSYVKPGGYLAVSFWQFLNDDARREKAQRTHDEALEFFSGELAEELLLHQVEMSKEPYRLNGSEEFVCTSADEKREHLVLRPSDLEQGDYLLGWKNLPGQYRYCHHFSDEEIDWLIAELSSSARVVASFCADGKTDNLNHYVVLRRNKAM